MFSREDEFVITFNSDPSQEGGNQLEMMEFDREKRAFKFFEVDFDRPPLEALSEVNPGKCLFCHREDPRPNWDNYFFWRGMYGGDDDKFTSNIAYLAHKYGADLNEDAITDSEKAVLRQTSLHPMKDKII